MPLDDAVAVRNASDAARLTGMAESAAEAYRTGGDIFGIVFPLNSLRTRYATQAAAGAWPHFLEGGKTAVRLPGANGGYLVNATREFIVVGGPTIPHRSVIFRVIPQGAWEILKRY